MDDRTGQQIGDYRLLRRLGEGSSTVVYLGEHLQNHSQVAVKMLHTKLVARERAAFHEEMRTVSELDHPGIVRVLDWGVEQGYPYVIMSYVPGGTLRQRYPQGSRLPLGLVVRYINQLADALHYAHDRQFIHRNVKPENILSGDDEQVLLSDFGLAMISSASITQGSQLGASTLAYMAPEHILGKSQPASDQYALAVIAYEWLAGEQMFQGTLAELSSQHLYAPPPPLQEKNPAVTSELEDVLIKALAKDPTQRYASVQDFAAALTKSVPADLLNAPITEDESDITIRKDVPIAEDENDITIRDSSTMPAPPIEQLAFPDAPLVAQDDPDKTDPALRVPATREDLLDDTDKRPVAIAFKSANSVEAGQMAIEAQDEEVELWPFAPDRQPVESGKFSFAFLKDASRPMKRYVVIVASLLALLLVSSVVYAIPQLASKPAPLKPTPPPLTANITITPQQKAWNKTYSISAVTGTPHAAQHQVQARILTITTQAQARTVKASGVGIVPGTGVAASGTLTFDNTALAPLSLPAGTVLNNTQGTAGAAQVVLNAALLVPAASAVQPHTQGSVAVHVVKAGKAGNIAAGQFVARGATWSATNAAAFAGGVDEQTYTFVQQGDIDNAAAILIQADAPAPAEVLKPKMRANERLVGGGVCNPNEQSDHLANERAATVTVSVWFTCSGNLYDYDRASMLTASLLRDEMKAAHYTAIDTIKMTVKQQQVANDQGTIALQMQAQASGKYSFDDGTTQNMARLLVGKSISEAETWLKGQPGVGAATIKLAGGSGEKTLPLLVQNITIIVV